MNEKIAIIGGLGHVGLPLAIWLAAIGYQVSAVDRDESKGALVRSCKMPFIEYGAEPMLTEVLGKTLFVPVLPQFPHVIEEADTIILTIGTPLDEYQNPRLEPVIEVGRSLLPHLRDGQHALLRSTVFPGTTRRLAQFFADSGKQIDVSFCPERIVQGHAIEELKTLPQIVSGMTPEAVARARAIFERLGVDVVECEPEEAECAKLFLNAWRYISFAVPNQFAAISESLGLDYSRIERAMKHGYARAAALPSPGLAAGPCLLKDTMQLVAAASDGFPLGLAARQINEGVPKRLVDQLGDVSGKRVAILGMAFKAENDDTRDSLSFRLAKLLKFRGAEVVLSDEYAARDDFRPLASWEVVTSDIVIIAAPHRAYRGLVAPGKRVVDVWGIAAKEGA